MSSTRSRAELAAFEREQQHRELPARPRSPLTVAAVTPTTRELASGAEFQASGEEVLSKLGPRSGGRTANQSVNGSIRDRLNKQRYLEEAKSERPDRTALGEFYLAEYEREQAAKRQALLDEQKRQRDRAAKEKQIQEENARMLPLRLMFDSAPGGSATPEERRRVMTALKKFPDAGPEKALSILLVLRGEI